MLLEAELRGRLERLSLRSRRRVTAQWSGRHSSRHKGESLDFADYREYVPGDDFRRIDHNLWARLGVLLVRQFEAEEELPAEGGDRHLGLDGLLPQARDRPRPGGDDGVSGSGRRRPGSVDRHPRPDRQSRSGSVRPGVISPAGPISNHGSNR